MTFFDHADELQLDPRYAVILERVLREQGITLSDLTPAQADRFLVLIEAGLSDRAARQRLMGGSLEISKGGN